MSERSMCLIALGIHQGRQFGAQLLRFQQRFSQNPGQTAGRDARLGHHCQPINLGRKAGPFLCGP